MRTRNRPNNALDHTPTSEDDAVFNRAMRELREEMALEKKMEEVWAAAQRAVDADRDRANASADPADHWDAGYEWWMRVADGLLALLRAAGAAIPVDRYTEGRPQAERERAWVRSFTHGWMMWADRSRPAELGHVWRGLRETARLELRGALRADRRDRDLYAADRAINRLTSATSVLTVPDDEPHLVAEATKLFSDEYALAYPGKRRGTRHYKDLLAAKLPLATAIVRRGRLAKLRDARESCARELDKAGHYPGLRALCDERRAVAEWLATLADWLVALGADEVAGCAPYDEVWNLLLHANIDAATLSGGLRAVSERQLREVDSALSRADDALREADEAIAEWAPKVRP
jgi:hypothetical protein